MKEKKSWFREYQLTWDKERSGGSSGKAEGVGDAAALVEVPRNQNDA